MADLEGQNETTDNAGSTTHFSGSLASNGDTVDVPSVAGNVISGVQIKAVNKDMEFSFDGGSSYSTLTRKAVQDWDVKGYITQIRLRATKNNTDWEVILNLEDF